VINIFKKASLILIFLSMFISLNASTGSWPKEIELQNYTFIIYQPQPQGLEGNKLKVLTAISLESNTNPEPVFGAMWFEAQVSVNKSNNRASLDNFKLNKLQFTYDDKKKIEQLTQLIESRMPQLSFDISYQKLLSTLEIKNIQSKESQDIKTEAPHIIVTEKPSILISIDGKARMKPVENSELFRIINTPYTIIMDSSKNKYYLNADKDTWYSAPDLTAEWSLNNSVPKEVASLRPKEENEDKNEYVKLHLGTIPQIIVSTKPTELISCDGKPEFTPIEKTTLMYVSNTESDLFMEMKSKVYYVLLAGRWYESKGLDSGWVYIKSTKLPKTFSDIPSSSDSSNVLYAIAGTPESQDAVLDAQIPQTAIIDRKTATLKVEYDGKPEYKKIEGTSLSYAINTQTPVIVSKNHYYACDNAVWFESQSADGAWKVATSIDKEIYAIPTNSPMYSITFVKIYKVTDDSVYVGYTAGYTNSYIYNETIVYGTGYSYEPWYGNHYYPYPSPWGFHMRWSPWYGWGFGMSYSSGPFTFMIGGGGWYGHGYWGHAPHYRYGAGYARGRADGFRQGYEKGKLAGKRPEIGKGSKRAKGDKNLYNSKRNKDRVKKTRDRKAGGDRFKSSRDTSRKNNVFADKKGNVHRKTDNGWEKRNPSGWDKQKRVDRSSNRNLDQRFNSRNRGNNFSRGSFSGGNRGGFSGGNRSGFSGGGRGGFSGGGGRRR